MFLEEVIKEKIPSYGINTKKLSTKFKNSSA